MPKKNPAPKDEKPQKQRFIDFAREHGADKDAKALEKAFPKVAKQPKE